MTSKGASRRMAAFPGDGRIVGASFLRRRARAYGPVRLGEGRQLRRCNLFATGAMRKRVARVVHRSNLLQAGEKADTYALRTAGAHGPINAAIARLPPHALPESGTPFADRTALV